MSPSAWSKAFFFGGAIAVISCYKGFTCQEGAHGVGQACTEAFVASFISILALDFALAVISKNIYEIFWPLKSLVALRPRRVVGTRIVRRVDLRGPRC